MDYITCSLCGKETEESDVFGNKKENCSWCDGLLKVKKGPPEQDNPNDKELKNKKKEIVWSYEELTSLYSVMFDFNTTIVSNKDIKPLSDEDLDKRLEIPEKIILSIDVSFDLNLLDGRRITPEKVDTLKRMTLEKKKITIQSLVEVLDRNLEINFSTGDIERNKTIFSSSSLSLFNLRLMIDPDDETEVDVINNYSFMDRKNNSDDKKLNREYEDIVNKEKSDKIRRERIMNKMEKEIESEREREINFLRYVGIIFFILVLCGLFYIHIFIYE